MKTITLAEIIKIVDEVYPDGMVGQYHEDPDGKHGDGLARFIECELRETFDEGDEDSLNTAFGVMDTAAGELMAVRDALEAAMLARQKGNG